MWGTSPHGDELTGNLANELDAISIDDRGLLRLFAEKSSRVDLGLLQHNQYFAGFSRASTSDGYRNKHSFVNYDFTFAQFDKPGLNSMQESERLKSPR
jgi:hypothetical protein